MQYDNKEKFRRESYSCYNYIITEDLMDKVCSHIETKIKPSGYWTKKRILKECEDCETPTDLLKKSKSAYSTMYVRKLSKEIFPNSEVIRKPKLLAKN